MTRRLTVADAREGLSTMAVSSRGEFPATPVAFVIDSREVHDGTGFIALRGEKVDGNDYVGDAVAAGASLVISERPAEGPSASLQVGDSRAALGELARWWRRQLGPTVIGVTGSVGKTTTKELIADVLQTRGPVLRSLSNWNTDIGVPLSLLGLTSEHRWVVLEMAMRGTGQIRQLAQIAEPEIGVVTNVGEVHAELLGSMDAIAWAKSELIQELPADGLAVLNADDPRVAAMEKKAGCPVVTYGFKKEAAVRAAEVEGRGLEGTSFSLEAGEQTCRVELPLAGRHNVLNAAAAAAVAINQGFDLDEAARALAAVKPYRLRRLNGPNGSLILDDSYNASPTSMRAALDLLKEVPGRHIAVIGDMRELGPYHEDAHADIGVYASERTDVIIGIGEGGKLIVDAAREAGHASAHAYLSKSDAVADLTKNLEAGDVVLVKASRALALETLVSALGAKS
ncbi:MAG: UDP-N-acetylmuramoyl-tripeptide--D-alanyl-D-alanine ligase [Dehalococcoidia bacterium]